MHRVEITGFTFAAAHRIEGHPKCGRLHGHNYEVGIVVERLKDGLDSNGMIADFGDIKREVKSYIDERLDHRFIVSNSNIEAKCIYYTAAMLRLDTMDDVCVLPGLEHSTAEELAAYLHGVFNKRFESMLLHVVSVSVKETSTSSAIYRD